MKKLFLLVLFVVIFSSCSSERFAIKNGYDFSKVKRVAVMGFSSSDSTSNSGDVVSDEFVLELLNRGYEVVERSKINTVLTEQKMSLNGEVDSQNIKKIGGLLGVDAIITGSVITYKADRNTTVIYNSTKDKNSSTDMKVKITEAEVGLNARMIDISSGEVIWSGSDKYEAFELSDALSVVVSDLVNSLKKQ